MPDFAYTTSPCHCLTLRQAARQVTQLYDTHLAATGLRATQYAVLRMIARNQPITMQGCADRLVMDRTTLTRALRPLQRDGLVAVEPGRDGRTRLLGLTGAGQAMLARTTPIWDEAQAEFEARYGSGETQDLRGMLARVVEQMA